MAKQSFEDFLMEKHAENYVGTKDCIVDDFNTFLTDLSGDEYIEYGDEFAKKSQKKLLEALKGLVYHSDKCQGHRNCAEPVELLFKAARQAIASAEESK